MTSIPDLTPTELKTLDAIAAHGTLRAAADALSLSLEMVDQHLQAVRLKTGRRFLPQILEITSRSIPPREPD